MGVRLPRVRQIAAVTLADPQGRDAPPLPGVTSSCHPGPRPCPRARGPQPCIVPSLAKRAERWGPGFCAGRIREGPEERFDSGEGRYVPSFSPWGLGDTTRRSRAMLYVKVPTLVYAYAYVPYSSFLSMAGCIFIWISLIASFCHFLHLSSTSPPSSISVVHFVFHPHSSPLGYLSLGFSRTDHNTCR